MVAPPVRCMYYFIVKRDIFLFLCLTSLVLLFSNFDDRSDLFENEFLTRDQAKRLIELR